jgi:hypothetical protein
VLRRTVFGCHVDAVPFAEEVLRAQERVGEGAVRLVDAGGEGFGVLFYVAGGVFVWVDQALELEEFAAEIGDGDLEGGGWGWAGWN